MRSKVLRNVVMISSLRRKFNGPSYNSETYSNSVKLDNDFLESFTKSYGSSRPTAPRSDTSRGKILASEILFAVLYERSKQITANAFKLIENFEQTNETTIKTKLADWITSGWEQEYHTVEKVIEAGHIAGLQMYEALADGEGEPEIHENMAVYTEAIYKQHIQGVGWGRMARKQEKAFKKIDKNLSEEIIA
jgi:hypothetical protein